MVSVLSILFKLSDCIYSKKKKKFLHFIGGKGKKNNIMNASNEIKGIQGDGGDATAQQRRVNNFL